jgi:D-alanyl-D-alanine carboxypeptidase/D-alanyl-D-alanine-endopeptidase (penicillin-binding protein 4)
LTAAAALYQFGSEYSYTTTLSQRGDSFYITFSGSPSFKTSDLNQLLQPLTQLGITHIAGDIILDTSQFKAPFYAAGTSYDDLGWYYEAPSTAVILDGNVIAYDFISGEHLGAPTQIKVQGNSSPITIINEVITSSKKDAKEHCPFNIDIKSNNTLRLYGCLSQQKDPRKRQLAVPNPSLYAKYKIKAFLDEHHIILKGTIIEGIQPPEAKTVAVHHSESLIKLITFMLKESDNLYADSLTKRLGISLVKEGSYQQGVFAIKQMLAEHTSLDLKLLDLSDGHGTRYNMMTPEQMTVFLTNIYQDKKIGPLFAKALPCFGVSGTLKDRMKDGVLASKVCAKTGSMHDISALSGYMMINPEKTIIFSIMINGINTPLLIAKNLEEKILQTVFLKHSNKVSSN